MMRHEYEKKLADLEQHLKQTHHLEIEKMQAEATSKLINQKSQYESKCNLMDRSHSQAIHELERQHNERVKELQLAVETAKKDYADKKMHIENQFKEVQIRVEKQNGDIEARKRAHQDALDMQQAIHQAEIAKRDRHIDELNALLRDSNEAVEETSECMKIVQEVAALVILMHKNSRPRTTEDFNASELYAFLASTDRNTPTANTVRGGSKLASEIIVSAAQMEAAYASSKVSLLTVD